MRTDPRELANEWNTLFPPPPTNAGRAQAKIDQRNQMRTMRRSPLQSLGIQIYADQEKYTSPMDVRLTRMPAPLVGLSLEDVFVRSRAAQVTLPSARQRKKLRWLHRWARDLHAGLACTTFLPPWEFERMKESVPDGERRLSWILLRHRYGVWEAETQGLRHSVTAHQRTSAIRILIDEMIARSFQEDLAPDADGAAVGSLAQIVRHGSWRHASCVESDSPGDWPATDQRFSVRDPVVVPLCITLRRDASEPHRRGVHVEAKVLSPIYQTLDNDLWRKDFVTQF